MAPSWHSERLLLGEFGEQGGRAACVVAKTATTVDALGKEAVVILGVLSNGMNGR